MDPSPKGRVQRYYVSGETVPFEEDSTHEFKGHRNLTQEDIPPKAKAGGVRSRAPVSRYICSISIKQTIPTVFKN